MASAGARRSRYAQVALTYLRWWPLRLYVLGAAALAVPMFLTSVRSGGAQLMALGGLLWITVGGAAVVAVHLKSQLADHRAQLMPHYRTPHLLLGAIAMLAMACVVAAIAVSRVGVSPLGTMALIALVVASVTWWIEVPNFTIGVVVNALVLSLLNRRVMLAAGDVIYGRWDGMALMLLALGAGALVALWVRWARLHDSKTIAATAPAHDTWLDTLVRRPVETRCIAAANLWVRVRHLRATGLGRMPWLLATALAASIMILPLLIGGGAGPAVGALEGFMSITMILPPALVFSHWSRRWPSLGYESLRPASRGRFVREVGLAIALDLAEAWLLIATAGLVPLVAFQPAHASALPLGGFLALSAATAVVVFALNAWILRFRSTPLGLLALALSGVAPLLPLFANRAIANSGMALPITLGLLTVGALVTCDAYARWCRTDLE